ncbi:hypothetical protein SRHO_G00051060 [Serrasalmus rhombeus]
MLPSLISAKDEQHCCTAKCHQSYQSLHLFCFEWELVVKPSDGSIHRLSFPTDVGPPADSALSNCLPKGRIKARSRDSVGLSAPREREKKREEERATTAHL